MRYFAVVVGVVCVGATAGALAPAEGAQVRHRVVHHDPAHDVVNYPYDGTGRHRAPRVRDPDITRVGVRHGDHYVWVRLTVRHLRRAAGPGADEATRNWNARIVTPHRGYRLYGWVHPEDEGDAPGIMMGGTGPDCLGLRVWFDYARDVVTTRVPRGCIGKPRWVRVGVVFQRQPSSGALYDDAFSPGPPSEGSYGTLSPRVYK